jgi:mono/diheme cytochrome c family protein
MTLAGLLACAFSLFIFTCMRSFKDVRREFLKFTGLFLLMASPVHLLSTVAYYHTLPEQAAKFISVALVTLQLAQYARWSIVFFFLVVGLLLVTGAVLFVTRRTFGVLSVLPLLLMILATAQFARVREFSRKPYVINKYMYSNGLRESETPFLSEVGASRYATWAWHGIDPNEGEIALGRMLFRQQCSVCHTYRGINAIYRKRAMLSSEETALQFLESYQFSHPYMPPFTGTREEREALARFLAKGVAENR